nr:peptidyl-prolyl cis-trans isomerase [Heyndrickxia acidiproducens]
MQIKGKVKFPITLDIGTWIFDDRKVDLDTYFDEEKQGLNEEEEYLKKTGKFFDRELKEGANPQDAVRTKPKWKRQHLKTGSFGIFIHIFLKNAEPLADAKKIVFETKNGPVAFPLAEAEHFILAFSHQGNALKETGPLHLLFDDGSNRDHPIQYVSGVTIE